MVSPSLISTDSPVELELRRDPAPAGVVDAGRKGADRPGTVAVAAVERHLALRLEGEWEATSDEWRSPELLAWLFNESPVKDEVVIDDRWGKDTRHKHGGYYTTEYTAGMQSGNHPWEESRGMGASYGYNRMETVSDYHTDRELLLMLIDLVSRGGNLLLDIGPTADGRIPVIMEERLTQMGDWLRPNGEAIYGTKAWRHPRQWSAGSIPKLEEKEYRAEYDITKMVDRDLRNSSPHRVAGAVD